MTSNETPPEAACPVCKAKVVWSGESPFRPFCSERCKLIDFGDWATEAHAIPGEQASLKEQDEEEY